MKARDKFRKNMRTTLESRGITQREFAALLSTSPSYVNRLLQGEIDLSIDRCEEIASALHVELSDLLLSAKKFSELPRLANAG